jgi:hypothetical protein
MPFQSAPNMAIVEIIGELAGEVVEITTHAKKDLGYSQAGLDELSEAVDSWVHIYLLPLLSVGYTYRRTHVRGLTDAIDLESENTTHAGESGALSGTVQANNVALAVKRGTGQTGRGARGRVYIPGIAGSNLEADNIVSEAFATAIKEALDSLTTAIASVNWVEVVLHRVASGAPLPVAVGFTVLEYVVVNRVVDSMRRRLPGRGV